MILEMGNEKSNEKMNSTISALSLTQNTDLRVRKLMGRTSLNANRMAEGVNVFAGILRDYPKDLETILILADLYLASGDAGTAARLYDRALEIDADNPEIRQRRQLAGLEGDQESFEEEPEAAPAINRLLRRLTVQSEQLDSTRLEDAASFVEKVLSSDSPADEVANRLDEMEHLLPAILELSIRKAVEEGKPEIAEGLKQVQSTFNASVEADHPLVLMNGQPAAASRPAHFRGRVLMLVADPKNPGNRVMGIMRGLENQGCRVTLGIDLPENSADRPEIVIASNPHMNPHLLETMAACTATRTPIILDLDCDFEHLPINHPDYETKGLVTPLAARAYTAALVLANLITVPSVGMAESMRKGGYPVEVVPDGWSIENPLWHKPAPPRNNLNIGWVGNSAQIEDLLLVRRHVVRILHEFSQGRIVIIGDPRAYQLFETLPENRKLYLPAVAEADFPYVLGQLDILLVPLRNIPYNLGASDLLLAQAGVKRVPWVASPMPGFVDWQAGGLIANTIDDWHTLIRQLVLDEEMRKSLGAEGRKKAENRENIRISMLWMDIIDRIMGIWSKKG